ncbi:MAG: hypothetical protein WC223_06325 [Bacteroidales bacterium]|jgi:hypothetical protein
MERTIIFNKDKMIECISYIERPVIKITTIKFNTKDKNWKKRIKELTSVMIDISVLDKKGNGRGSIVSSADLKTKKNQIQSVFNINQSFEFDMKYINFKKDYLNFDNWKIKFSLCKLPLKKDETVEVNFIESNIPKISEDEIIESLSNAEFTSISNSWLTNDFFFSDLKKIFIYKNPILLGFSATDKYKFGQCIHWFGIGKYIQDEIKVNRVFIQLLSNKSLLKNKIYKKLVEGFTTYNYGLGQNIADVKIEKVNSFILDGLLAKMAYYGGAYIEHLRTASSTKNKSHKFANEIIQNRYDDFEVYQILSAWSNWFTGYWDYTYFIFDKIKGEFWILAISDAD